MLALLTALAFTVYFAALSIRFARLRRQRRLLNMFDCFLVGIGVYFVVPYLIGQGLSLRMPYATSAGTVAMVWALLGLNVLVTWLTYNAFGPSSLRSPGPWRIARPLVPALKLGIVVLVCAAFTASVRIIAAAGGVGNIEDNFIIRQELASLGPAVIILQVPLGLALYVWSRIINGASRDLLTVMLAVVCTVIALTCSFVRGQRTDLIMVVLLPAMALYAYRGRVGAVLVAVVATVSFAAWYALSFKASYSVSAYDGHGLAFTDVTGDFDRNWPLWLAIDRSTAFGTAILPYPGSGYIYTATALIPRDIIPWKGYSAESWFTLMAAPLIGVDPGAGAVEALDWGFVFGFMTEAILNFGLVAAPLIGVFQGLVLRLLQRLSTVNVAAYAVCALLAVLMNGHTIFNLVIIFVPVLVTVLILSQPGMRPTAPPTVQPKAKKQHRQQRHVL